MYQVRKNVKLMHYFGRNNENKRPHLLHKEY